MSISASDVGNFFFALIALAAVACFGVLIYLQVEENKYYWDPLSPGGSIMLHNSPGRFPGWETK